MLCLKVLIRLEHLIGLPEEPLYKQIITKYDEMAEETDPGKKEAIAKEINDLTVQAGKISVSSEFSNLMESMGGKGG